MNSLEEIDPMEEHTNLAWNKLEKTFKLKKLYEYADSCAVEKALAPETVADLKKALRERVNRKQLQKTKDVCYNKEEGRVTAIAILHFHEGSFSFRNTDAVSPLLSLAPKNKNKTVKKHPLHEVSERADKPTNDRGSEKA
jgi:hypothetical protein